MRNVNQILPLYFIGKIKAVALIKQPLPQILISNLSAGY